MTQDQQQVEELQRLARELSGDRAEVSQLQRQLHEAQERAASTELLYRRQNLWRSKELAERRFRSLELRLAQVNEILSSERTQQAKLQSVKNLD